MGLLLDCTAFIPWSAIRSGPSAAAKEMLISAAHAQCKIESCTTSTVHGQTHQTVGKKEPYNLKLQLAGLLHFIVLTSTGAGEVVQSKELQSSDSDYGFIVIGSHALSTVTEKEKQNWIIDSGATSHMCNNDKQFTELENIKEPIKIKVGDGFSVMAEKQGYAVTR